MKDGPAFHVTLVFFALHATKKERKKDQSTLAFFPRLPRPLLHALVSSACVPRTRVSCSVEVEVGVLGGYTPLRTWVVALARCTMQAETTFLFFSFLFSL